jgi:hypothetical protein
MGTEGLGRVGRGRVVEARVAPTQGIIAADAVPLQPCRTPSGVREEQTAEGAEYAESQNNLQGFLSVLCGYSCLSFVSLWFALPK